MPTDRFDDQESSDKGKQGDEDRWEEVRERAQEAVRRANKQGGRRTYALLNNKLVVIGGGVVAVAVVSLVLYGLFGDRSSQSANKTVPQQGTASGPGNAGTSPGGSSTGRSTTTPPSGPNNDINRVAANGQSAEAQTERWPARLARIGLSLSLAALIGAVLGFRPRRDGVGGRPPAAARTQILIALLASALMLVAAGDVVIALTIVGVALLIRVRPLVIDSRESTAMLVSAGVGVACGAGRWEVALILGGFAVAVLWALESSQQEELVRVVDLSVETRSVKETNEVLRELFEKNHIAAEFLRIDTSDPTGQTGIVHYSINVKQATSLDAISEDIFSEDADNVLSVNWQQRRWPAVAYR